MDALKNNPDLDLIVGRMRRSTKSNKSRATLTDVHRMYHFAIHNLPAFLVAMDSFLDSSDESSEIGGGGGGEKKKVIDSLKKFSIPLRQCDVDLKSFKQLVEHVLDFEALPELHIKVISTQKYMFDININSFFINLFLHVVSNLPSISHDQCFNNPLPFLSLLSFLASKLNTISIYLSIYLSVYIQKACPFTGTD
jgi:hypothetical protein